MLIREACQKIYSLSLYIYIYVDEYTVNETLHV